MESSKLIKSQLDKLAREQSIDILLAVESGSRAWGFASPDSDYDIRFIYRKDVNSYMTLWERRDTVEFMTEDNFDGAGWDIDKTLTLLAKSNSTLHEWLFSPIVYDQNEAIVENLRSVAQSLFSPVAAMNHYIGTTKNFLSSCLEENVKLKNYFYALRTVLAGDWIIKHSTIPPVLFSELIPLAPENIQEIVHELILLKSTKDESYLHPNNIVLKEFLVSTLENNITQAPKLKSGIKMAAELDDLFRDIVIKNWL